MTFDKKLILWEEALTQETGICEEILEEIKKSVKNKNLSSSEKRKIFQLLLKFGENKFKKQILKVLKLFIAATDQYPTERVVYYTFFSNEAFKPENRQLYEFIELIEIDDDTSKIHYKGLADVTLYAACFANKSGNITETIKILRSNLRKILEHFCNQDVSLYFEYVSGLLTKFVVLPKFIAYLQPPMTVDFVEYTVCETMKQLPSVMDDENMLIFLNLVNYIMSKSQTSSMFVDLCKSLVSSAEQVFNSSTHQICFYLLGKFLNFMTVTDAENAKELCLKLYKIMKRICDNKDLLSSTVILETACIVGRKMAKLDNLAKIEMTSSFALTYVTYCNILPKVLRNYPNKENKDCTKCSFVRKHVTIEMLKTILTVFNASLKLGILNSQLTISMWQNIEYQFTTIADLKCEVRDSFLEKNSVSLYNSLIGFIDHPNQISTCFQIFKNIIRMIMKTLKLIKPGRITNEVLVNLCGQIVKKLNIKDHPEEVKWILQLLVAYYLSTGNAIIAMKYLAITAQTQHDNSNVDFDFWKLFVDPQNDVCYLIDKNFDTADVILLEMKTINRFNLPNRGKLVGMFSALMNYTKDNLKLSMAIQCINDDQLSKLDQKIIINIRNEIRKIQTNHENNVEIYSSLAFIYHHLFINDYDQLKEKLHNIYDTNKNNPLVKQNMASAITVKDESRILHNMTKCLKYLEKLANCYTDKDKDRLLSLNAMLNLLSSLGLQFFMRNAYAKAIESYIVMQRLAIDERYSPFLFMALIFLLDHYKFLPEKLMAAELEQQIKKANAIVETFDTAKENTQTTYLIYLISLVTYYSRVKNYTERDKAAKQFKKLMEKFIDLGSSNVRCINACYYLNSCRIILSDDSIRAEQIISYMKHAVYEINNSTKNETDCYGLLQILWITLVREAVNLFLNSSFYDYEIRDALNSVYHLAMKSGFASQCAELLVYSNLWNLVNERMNLFEQQMMELKALLNITDLDDIQKMILNIEKKPFTAVVNANGMVFNDFVRDSAVPSDSLPKLKIFDISSTQLVVENIQNLFHPMDCKCSYCREPQLKFRLFQIGCMISRMMFINDQFAICQSVNKYALDKWDAMRRNYIPKIADKVETTILRQEFVDFSIRWLMECVDVLMIQSKFNEVNRYIECARAISEFTVNNPSVKVVLIKDTTLQYCKVTSHAEVLKMRHKCNDRKNFAKFANEKNSKKLMENLKATGNALVKFDTAKKEITHSDNRNCEQVNDLKTTIDSVKGSLLIKVKPLKPKLKDTKNEDLFNEISLSDDSSDNEVDSRTKKANEKGLKKMPRPAWTLKPNLILTAKPLDSFNPLTNAEMDTLSEKLSKLDPGTAKMTLPNKTKTKTTRPVTSISSDSKDKEITAKIKQDKEKAKSPNLMKKTTDKVTKSKARTSKITVPIKSVLEGIADKENAKTLEKRTVKTARPGTCKSTESKQLEEKQKIEKGKDNDKKLKKTCENKTGDQKNKLGRNHQEEPSKSDKPDIKHEFSFSEDEVEAKKEKKKIVRNTRQGTSKSKDSNIVPVDNVKTSSRTARTPSKRTLRKKLEKI